MKTILENTELLKVWLGLPPLCRNRLITMRDSGRHINTQTTDFYHYAEDVSYYLLALCEAGYLNLTQRLDLYKLIVGEGGENEQTTI